MAKKRQIICRVLVCIVTYLAERIVGSKHVVFVHGIFSSPIEFQNLSAAIQRDFPGMNTTAIDAFNYLDSLEPMWKQVEVISRNLADIMAQSPDGIVLICYSQGGLLCRGLVSILPHNVVTLIALSCPLAGQFGDSEYLNKIFPDSLKEDIYKILYTQHGQDVSLGNYWNDPHHHDLYLQYANYLPIVNNEKMTANSTEFKNNFLRLKNLILVGGPDDGVITPWQSSQFQFYDANETVQSMAAQPWFVMDTFGLRTLYSRGGVFTYTFSGIKHTSWYSNDTVYETCIKPWLK